MDEVQTPVVINPKDKVGQDQIHDLLFGEKLSWQSIIYDLINTEQLDPWDIDIGVLANRYLEKVRELEEANFFVSSKVLLAASLLLRMKSEILLNRDIPSLDEILFGSKEEKKYEQERIELDDEIPNLVPRTPLPRFRKVTLQELMSALGKAIKTENRRIRKEIVIRQRERETDTVLPRNVINIQESIKGIYKSLKGIFSGREERLAFTELMNKHFENKEVGRNQKIAVFVSLLHLDNQQKIWLEQEAHFEEIWILLKEIWLKNSESTINRIYEELERVGSEELPEEIEEAVGFSNEIEKELE